MSWVSVRAITVAPIPSFHPVRSKLTNSLMQKPLFTKQPVINPGIRFDEAGDVFFECDRYRPGSAAARHWAEIKSKHFADFLPGRLGCLWLCGLISDRHQATARFGSLFISRLAISCASWEKTMPDAKSKLDTPAKK
jgi:hypothetical protein